MIWGVFGLILTAILLAVLITKKNIGRAVPLALVMVVGVIAFFAWYQDQELSQSQSRIQPTEVELADMNLVLAGRGIRDLSGRIRNHSAHYTLQEVVLRVFIQDCVESAPCETIDQTDVRLKLDIPPGQARDVRERAYFKSTLQPRGETRINYDVISTRAD